MANKPSEDPLMYPKAPLKGLFGPEMAIYGLFSLLPKRVFEYWDGGVRLRYVTSMLRYGEIGRLRP